jgi:hypothetical protein
MRIEILFLRFCLLVGIVKDVGISLHREWRPPKKTMMSTLLEGWFGCGGGWGWLMMNGGRPCSQGGDVLKGGLEGRLVCGVQKSKTMFLHLAILCLWTGSSTFQEFLGRKCKFLCFNVSRKQACGHGLIIDCGSGGVSIYKNYCIYCFNQTTSIKAFPVADTCNTKKTCKGWVGFLTRERECSGDGNE